MEDVTTGRTFTAPNGTVFRPSTFLNLTLDSYGPVHTASPKPEHPRRCRCGRVHHKDDGITGTPLDPATYDYVRAARDAIHFGKLIDRFWQNLRRASGRHMQYFAAVEPQKRLAMHVHAAVRGTIPRKLLRQVTQATYHQVWWPQHDHAVYSEDAPPVWDEDSGSYVDPPTASTSRVSTPAPIRAGKCLGYLVKYITKELSTMASSHEVSGRLVSGPKRTTCAGSVSGSSVWIPATRPTRRRSGLTFDRLAQALRVQPCSESCANWPLYGIQPDDPAKGLIPGAC